jgi:DNA-binding MarR family transcriptional regulator
MKAGTARVHEAIGRLQRLVDLFQQRRVQLAQGAGLTEPQWEILERIAAEHFMPSMFARHRESSAPAVSRVIRQLVRKKLITVSLSDTDGRQRRYHLTARGQKTLEALRATRRRAIDAIWMDLDPRALAAFTEFSGGLIARLEAYARQGKGASRETPAEARGVPR